MFEKLWSECLFLWCGLTTGSIAYQVIVHNDWSTGFEHSFFMGIPLLIIAFKSNRYQLV